MPTRKPNDRSKSRRGPSMGSGNSGGPFKKKREGFQKPDTGKFQSARKGPRPDGDRDKPRRSSSDSVDKSSRSFRDERASRNRPGGYKDKREDERSPSDKRPSRPSNNFGKPFAGKPAGGRVRNDERPDRDRRGAPDKSLNEKGPRRGPDSEKPASRRSTSGFENKKPSDARPFTRRPPAGDEKPFRGRADKDRPDSRERRPRTAAGDRPTRGDVSKPDGRSPRKEGRPERNERFPKPSATDEPKKFDRSGVVKKDSAVKTGTRSVEVAKVSGSIRLNKYIANSGVCSRREADELIAMGLISVNGKVVTTLGFKVSADDEIRHESKVLRAEKPVYILMNKPKGFLTTTTDPQERNTVMNLLGGVIKERVYPVGRLDRNTTGLLMLTNDGDLAEKLMHPSHNVKKIYKVELDRPLTKADATKVIEGVTLEEGRAIVDDLAVISDDRKTLGLEIHIGWNRVVRRIFESLSYQVVKLDRSSYAGLTKKELGRGEWRFLKKEELILLKHFK